MWNLFLQWTLLEEAYLRFIRVMRTESKVAFDMEGLPLADGKNVLAAGEGCARLMEACAVYNSRSPTERK
jgi:hypothetical protein